MIYAQKKGSDTLHWYRNCTQLPKKYKLESIVGGRPRGDLCSQCRSKERRGTGLPLVEPTP